MKKVLAALAVVAVSSFGSMALAADGDAPVVKGNIEVYGAAKLSVDLINTGSKTAGDDKKLQKVSSNSSRLGFKGTEDLGNGLNAVYQLELGINKDGTTTKVTNPGKDGIVNTADDKTTDVNTLSLRNTYVGLKSDVLGMVVLGTMDTPYKNATARFDAFGDSMGDYNAIIGNVNGDANFELRPKDVIAYATPTWGGVQVTAAVVETGMESSNGKAANAKAYSTSAVYNAGPLALALAYEIHRNGVISGWDDTASKMKNTGTRVGAGYTIGGTTLGLVYEAIKDEKNDSVLTRNAMYASVTQTIGKEKIKLAYGKAADGKDPKTKTGATMMAAGVDHAFSKRTTVYALYAKTKNDKDATYGLGQGGAGGSYKPGKDEDPSVVSIGMNYSF